MSAEMSQHEVMQRAWCRVTSKGQYACGPICKVEDLYDAVLVIIRRDGVLIVLKNARDPFASFTSPDLFSEAHGAHLAVKFVADFIFHYHNRSAS